eukprot:COSAG01_NODE_36545_length_516_cov_0.937650_2_plen_101_part_00
MAPAREDHPRARVVCCGHASRSSSGTPHARLATHQPTDPLTCSSAAAQVDSLISAVADEAGLSLAEKFPEMAQGTPAAAEAQSAAASQEDELQRRLEALK